MPSKEDLQRTQEERSAATTQDFLSLSVDELVAEIKENLRLRAKPCHAICKQRASPYKVPARTSAAAAHGDLKQCHSCGSPKCLRTCAKQQHTHDDPYELLQVLLREGSLIKEAVKRLQTPTTTTKEVKKRSFYEDCDSPHVHVDV